MNLDWIQIPVLRTSDSTMFNGGSLKTTPLKINGWNSSEGLVQMIILSKWVTFRVSCQFSAKLTYPTLGSSENHREKCETVGGYVSSLEIRSSGVVGKQVVPSRDTKIGQGGWSSLDCF